VDLARPSRGFTLLELLVVLVLVGLMSGLIGPSLIRSLDAARERAVGRDLQAVLEGLPVRAYAEGAPMTVDASALRRWCEACTPEWQLEVDAPLRYDVSGIGGGGVVHLRSPRGAVLAWQVLPVTGRVQPLAPSR
jgi:general secretion pathway protein G